MKKCNVEICSNNVFGGGYCPYHQYIRRMKGGDLYKPKSKPKKQIPKESKKRKVERPRYLDKRRAFIQKHKDNGTYYCYLCLGEFDQASDFKYCTIEHSLGRVGDNYKDEAHWRLMHCECNDNLEHKTIEWFEGQPYWEDFLKRLKADDELAWHRIQRKIEKSKKENEFFD